MLNIEAISPIIENIIKESLEAKVYVYGKLQKSLTNRVATGNLKNSIKAVIQKPDENSAVIQIMAFGQPLSNTYAYWLINGRNAGKYPPISAIMDWIKNKKSFRIRDFKTGRYLEKNDKNVRQAAFLVSRSMSKFGFKSLPYNFIEISYDKILNNEQIKDIIGEATVNDLLEILEGI